MDADLDPVGPADDFWILEQRRWAQGWRRIVFPGVFLVYLVEVGGAVAQYNHGIAEVVGFLLLGAFCVDYLVALSQSRDERSSKHWPTWLVAVVVFAAELPFARSSAFVMCVFIVVLSVARLGARAWPVVAVATALAVLLPPAVPAWHQGIDAALDNGSAIAIPMVGLAMFGFFRVVRGNRALAEARSELARLAAENERFRIARDLHDLLGHSLTTITVKAELARRLGPTDPEGAAREISEVEALSRRALSDVRAAVANYRQVTLTGELATGRELLRAAGITADLPKAVDGVDDRAQDVFAWVVREGLTNVVRHARAEACTIRFSPRSVEIIDDGVGGRAAVGNGLAGLKERVAAAGGVVEVGPGPSGGWRLLVTLEAAKSPVS